MVSINQSASSYGVRGHVSKASSNAAASVARLSSGHRITQSSEDVAGLAVGTTIQTGITSLRQAMRNAAQGTSLLQVADGALAQISDILQRQKTIATQANSGVLSNKERIYLNNEFQALTAQIDQIVGNTTFSGTHLLDGSLAEYETNRVASALDTNVGLTGNATISSTSFIRLSTVPSNGDRISLNGVEFEFVTGVPASDNQVSIVAGSTSATRHNLVNALMKSTDARLGGLSYLTGGGTGALGVTWAGGTRSAPVTVTSAVLQQAVAGTFTMVGTKSLPSSSTIRDGLDDARTLPIGTSNGDLTASGGNTTNDYGPPMSVHFVSNNPAFIGRLGEGDLGSFTAVYNSGDLIDLSLQVGDETYEAMLDVAATSFNAVTLFSFSGGQMELRLKGNMTASGVVNDQATTDAWVDRLNADLANITFVQNRDVTTYNPTYIPGDAGISLVDMMGMTVDWQSDDFSGGIEDFDILPPSVTGSGTVFKAVINSETYLSRDDIGSSFLPNSVITLVSEDHPYRQFNLVTSATAVPGKSYAMDVSSDAKAASVAAAIRAAFTIGETNIEGGTVIQIGARASELLGISIADTSSVALYGRGDISVLTEEAAAQASSVVDTAIATVTARRASVGALQSRLDFTSGNLITAIENQDAARGGILDTDFAGESTRYADAQVQLKMGVSLLAQVNKIPKDLMSLLE